MTTVLENLALELQRYLRMERYEEFGKLQRASKSLFKYAFDNGLLFMIKAESPEEVSTFFIDGKKIFALSIIGLDYQENEFTSRGESLSFNHFTTDSY